MRVKRRWNRINAQILVWAGDERLQLKYNGVPIVVPAYNETAILGPKHPFRFAGAKNGSGNMIPGTILVEDIITRTPEGGVIKAFDVGEFCDFLERDQSWWFDRGLEIVTDPLDVETAMESARPVWEQSQIVRAQQIIAAEMERVASHEAKGQPVPLSSSAKDVEWAVKHLRNRAPEQAQFGKDDLAKVLSGQYVGPPEKTERLTAEKLSSKELLSSARELGLKLTKSELEGILDDDEDQIAFIKEKIAGRREEQAANA